MGSKGGGSSKSTQTIKQDPWVGAQPYLAQTFQGAQRLYGAGGWTPAMGAMNQRYLDSLTGRQIPDTTGTVSSALDLGNGLLNQGRSILQTTPMTAPTLQIGPVAAVGGGNQARPFGSVAPIAGVENLNPYLQQMQQANVNTAMRGYADATQNAAQTLLPAIRGGAEAAGQYGGSRQGIAEGLVGQQLARNARDLGIASLDAGTNLYGGAFNDMANRALNTQQYNANLGLQNNQMLADWTNRIADRQAAAEQFNANLALQNNAQAMANNAQNAQILQANRAGGLNALQTGLGLAGSGQGLLSNQYNLQDQSLQNALQALQAPAAYDWQNLGNYNAIVNANAQLGRSGTETAKTPYYTNPGANALGGGLSGALLGSTLAGGLGLSTGMGSALGGGAGLLLGLLSDRRTKTDIEKVGALDDGLTVYRYRYKAGGPLQIGVMADEVKRVHPEAVVRGADGFDRVRYGLLG